MINLSFSWFLKIRDLTYKAHIKKERKEKKESLANIFLCLGVVAPAG